MVVATLDHRDFSGSHFLFLVWLHETYHCKVFPLPLHGVIRWIGGSEFHPLVNRTARQVGTVRVTVIAELIFSGHISYSISDPFTSDSCESVLRRGHVGA